MNKNIMNYIKKYGLCPTFTTLSSNNISSLKCPYCGTPLRYEYQGDWYWIYACDKCDKTMMTEPDYEMNKITEENRVDNTRSWIWLSDKYNPKQFPEASISGEYRPRFIIG